jgi:hypothetical protein
MGPTHGPSGNKAKWLISAVQRRYHKETLNVLLIPRTGNGAVNTRLLYSAYNFVCYLTSSQILLSVIVLTAQVYIESFNFHTRVPHISVYIINNISRPILIQELIFASQQLLIYLFSCTFPYVSFTEKLADNYCYCTKYLRYTEYP